jgi:hypothetical protein
MLRWKRCSMSTTVTGGHLWISCSIRAWNGSNILKQEQGQWPRIPRDPGSRIHSDQDAPWPELYTVILDTQWPRNPVTQETQWPGIHNDICLRIYRCPSFTKTQKYTVTHETKWPMIHSYLAYTDTRYTVTRDTQLLSIASDPSYLP